MVIKAKVTKYLESNLTQAKLKATSNNNRTV